MTSWFRERKKELVSFMFMQETRNPLCRNTRGGIIEIAARESAFPALIPVQKKEDSEEEDEDVWNVSACHLLSPDSFFIVSIPFSCDSRQPIVTVKAFVVTGPPLIGTFSSFSWQCFACFGDFPRSPLSYRMLFREYSLMSLLQISLLSTFAFCHQWKIESFPSNKSQHQHKLIFKTSHHEQEFSKQEGFFLLLIFSTFSISASTFCRFWTVSFLLLQW